VCVCARARAVVLFAFAALTSQPMNRRQSLWALNVTLSFVLRTHQGSVCVRVCILFFSMFRANKNVCMCVCVCALCWLKKNNLLERTSYSLHTTGAKIVPSLPRTDYSCLAAAIDCYHGHRFLTRGEMFVWGTQCVDLDVLFHPCQASIPPETVRNVIFRIIGVSEDGSFFVGHMNVITDLKNNASGGTAPHLDGKYLTVFLGMGVPSNFGNMDVIIRCILGRGHPP